MDEHETLEDGLLIEHAYGSVRWKGPIQIRRNLQLDQIVQFRRREIEVYPDTVNKPPIGEELNRNAEVTLHGVWPLNNENSTYAQHWSNRLKEKLDLMGARFLGYTTATGTVTFEVDHFSKYGLNHADEDDDVEMPIRDQDTSRQESDLQLHVQRARTDRFIVDEDNEVSTPQTIQEFGLTPRFFAPMTAGFSITPIRSFKRKVAFNDRDPVFDASLPVMKKLEVVETTAHRQVLSRRFDYENQVVDEVMVFDAKMEDAPKKKTREIEKTEPLPREGPLPSELTTRPLEGGPIDVVASKGPGASIRMISKSGGLMTIVKPSSCKVAVVPLDFPDDLETDEDCNTKTLFVQPSGDFQGLINSYIRVHDLYDKESQARLWTLCALLFKKNETTLEEWHIERAQMMGSWIQKVLRDEEANTLWEYVSRGKFDELPFSCLQRFVVSASLPLCHDTNVRSKARKQIDYWLNNRQLDLVNQDELKTYMVIAGMRKLTWKRASGEYEFVNIYSGLHWLQAFGLHVWYLGEEDEPISRSVDRLIEDANDQLLMLPIRDPAWELIRFAGAEHHRPIEPCLEAAQFCTSWVSDFYPSWHMWAVIQTAGNWKMDPVAEEKLHRQYAAQLVSCGSLHLAVFVLSHIQNEINRTLAIQSLLIAEVASLNDALINKMMSLVKIPDKLIYTALALHAKLNFKADDEFEYHVKAKNWTDAESLFVNKLGREAILLGDCKRLSSLTEKLKSDLSIEQRWCPRTLLFAEYSYLLVIVASKGEKISSELVQLCNSIDERLDGEEHLKAPFKEIATTIALYVATLRATIGAPSWMQGSAAGKRCVRFGFSTADMGKINRLLRNAEAP
ncbi:unnamed protein product, partial [Mesorhabditis belari]|uniref:Nuclear pore complex protein Nup98-Nup96 n=1 Tax=Mesorhabditis belari TaxID=2138241 RepID=A0AAF3EG91_9BILA